MNTQNIATYSDGMPCRAGDLVWFHEGRLVARVEQVLPTKLLPAEAASEGNKRNSLRLSLSLFGQSSAPFFYCAKSSGKVEGITRFTKTEELAVKILFHMLGRQLGEILWGNTEWCCQAMRERFPYEGRNEGSYGWVWILSVARRAQPKEIQTFRFNHITMRFSSTSEPWEPLPPFSPLFPLLCYELPTSRPRRSFVKSSGERFMEGDLIWVASYCHAATVRRFERILLPTDSDAEWIVEYAEELTEDGKPVPLLVSQAGFTPHISTFESAEGEWYKRVSETEELALYLLVQLLRQHPYAHIKDWIAYINFSYAPAVDSKCSTILPRFYDWSQWELHLTFRNEQQDKIHGWRNFRFNCETCEFSLIFDACYPDTMG